MVVELDMGNWRVTVMVDGGLGVVWLSGEG